MGQLNNLYISSSFQGLLKLTDSTTGLTNTLQTVQGGDGSNSPLQMSTTEVNISGSFYINNVPITNGTNGTSGTSGAAGSSGTSGAAGSSGTSGTGTSGTSGSSGTGGGGDRNGLITTGSITDTQQITGSLILGNTTLSGSLIGNTVNGGLIKIQTEANRSGSLQFNITGSSPISQSNVIFGNAGTNTASGSIIISGSNNILLTASRINAVGQYGYIGGNNIVNVIPTLNTASLVSPTMVNNILYGATSFNFVTSSIPTPQASIPVFSNNQTQGGVTINHQSGSVNMTTNIIMANGFSSTANTTPLYERTQIAQNLVAGISSISLNHNSSSIVYSGNIGGGMTVTNNYTSSVFPGITVQGNIFNGTQNTLIATGSDISGVRRAFNYNIVNGYGNIINSNRSGSSTAHLVSTAILGQQLIVSASNTSNTLGGSTFVGRFNATGSLQESSQDAIFVVGTGTSDGARRNALHIDSGSNIRMTGSLLVSGSSTITGSVRISGSLYVTDKINDLKIWTGSANVNSIGIGNSTLNSQSGSDLSNIAIGNGALATNITGSSVVAIGGGALGNSVSSFNLAVGASALGANTTGENNIAIGQSAFQANTIGGKNTAIGWNSGVNNLTGSTNTIIGAQALSNNVNGSGNIAIGHYAGYYSTGSNGFYVGNDNYGSLSNDQNKSLMYGEFNNTTNNQSLRINAKTNITNNLVVTGSIDITGTYYVNGVAFSGGTSGTSGSSGATGSSGTSGTSGSSGQAGSSGTSGSDGTSGSNGSSGTSGDSLFTNQGSYWNTTNNIQITGSLIVTSQINDLFISGSNGNVAISTDQNNVLKNSTDGKNIGIGNYALMDLITGEGNIAIGDRALEQLNGQNNNLAIGNSALRLSQGQFNTAIGATALINNTSGSGNFGFGYNTLGGNTTGNSNLGIGTQALVNNVDGSTNVGVGNNVLTQNVSGSGNIVLGNNAGYNETSSNNFYIGNQNYNSIDNDRSGSLIWGKLDSTTANQTLQINATTNVKNNLVVTGSLNVSNGATITGSVNISGSLNATTLSSATGYQDITTIVSASLDLSTANVWFVEEDNNPVGAHLDVTNLIDGQQISIVWYNSSVGIGQVVTCGSNINVTNNSNSTQFTVTGGKKSLLIGAVYGGTLYLLKTA